LYGIEFAVVPRTLQELQHQNAHALANGSQSGPHGGSRFAFAGSGIHDDQTTTDISHA
jgi:hypothetical protein